MKKFSAILALTAVAALPISSAFADPTPKDPIGDLIKKIQAMPLDQKIREAFLAISLPAPVGIMTALLDAYAVEKSEQKKLEIKGKIEALLKKYKIGKYVTGEMMMKKPVGAYLYQSKAYKPVKVESIKDAKDGKDKKEEKKVQTVAQST